MKFLGWIKESLQGRDGKSSLRSLTNAYTVVFLITALVVNHIVLTNYVIRNTNPNARAIDVLNVNIYLIYGLCIYVCLLFGIIAFQSITEFVRSVRGQPAAPVEVVTHTQTTTQVTPSVAEEEIKEDKSE